jgi:hypothetical protein
MRPSGKPRSFDEGREQNRPQSVQLRERFPTLRRLDLHERIGALDKSVVTEGLAEEFIDDSVELAKANSN